MFFTSDLVLDCHHQSVWLISKQDVNVTPLPLHKKFIQVPNVEIDGTNSTIFLGRSQRTLNESLCKGITQSDLMSMLPHSLCTRSSSKCQTSRSTGLTAQSFWAEANAL